MKVVFNKEQIEVLIRKIKLCNTLNSIFSKMYLKISKDKFEYILRGATGVFKVSIDIESDFENPVYLAVDYNKWQMTINKFEFVKELVFSLKNNVLKVTSNEGDKEGVISLGTVNYNESSSEARIINEFLPNKKGELAGEKGIMITFTEEITNTLKFMDNFFSIQASKVNSIGLGKKDIMYSDRATVLKYTLSEELPKEYFKFLKEEDYIHIHSFVVKLLDLLCKTSPNVYFNNDYSSLYWEDDNSALFLVSEDREVALPTAEQWEMIKPSENNSITFAPSALKDCLNLFIGFYEGSMWKPISFDISTNKTSLFYKHPTTEVVKDLEGAEGNAEGSFILDSEALRRVVSRADDQKLESMTIFYDDEAPGVLIKAGDLEAILSKLENF